MFYHVSLSKSDVKEIVVSLVAEEPRSPSEWNDSSTFHLGAVHVPELDMSVSKDVKMKIVLLMIGRVQFSPTYFQQRQSSFHLEKC